MPIWCVLTARMLSTWSDDDRVGKDTDNAVRQAGRRQRNNVPLQYYHDEEYEGDDGQIPTVKEEIEDEDIIGTGEPGVGEEEEYFDDNCLPKVKRRKISDGLTEEQEVALVEWFQENPLFYNQSLKDFKNKAKREKLLEDKAKQLGITTSDLLVWFKSQRTIYGRLKKKKDGQAIHSLTARQRWVIRAFSFLAPYVLKRTDHMHPGNVSVLAEDETEGQEEEFTKVTPVSLYATHTSGMIGEEEEWSCTSKGKATTTRQTDIDASISEYISDTHRLHKQLGEVSNNNPTDSIHRDNNVRRAWTDWMATEVMGLQDDLWRSFQKKSFELVMSHVEKSSALRRQQQQ